MDLQEIMPIKTMGSDQFVTDEIMELSIDELEWNLIERQSYVLMAGSKNKNSVADHSLVSIVEGRAAL